MRKCRRCNNCLEPLQKRVERDTILHYPTYYILSQLVRSSEATSDYTTIEATIMESLIQPDIIIHCKVDGIFLRLCEYLIL